MIVKINLLSDAIFGSGQSVPGMEDISVLHDVYGFPYISGTNVKGNLRESAQNILAWSNRKNDYDLDVIFGAADTLGMSGEKRTQIKVSDFMLPKSVRADVVSELGITAENLARKSESVLDLFTELRTFTRIENGTAAKGSLRTARCVQAGLVFYGEIFCEGYEDLIQDALKHIKWLGTLRSRGFGMVQISCPEGGKVK